MLMYSKLFNLVNTLFNDYYRSLYSTIGSSLRKNYALATDIELKDAKVYDTVLGDVDAYDKRSDEFPRVVLAKTDIEVPRAIDTLILNNQVNFICFVPKDIDSLEFDPIERIKIIYNIFKYIIDTTAPVYPKDSILGTALTILPEYLTIANANYCFSGLTYSNFIKAFGINPEDLTIEQFRQILEVDLPDTFNYSLIYAIAVMEKE